MSTAVTNLNHRRHEDCSPRSLEAKYTPKPDKPWSWSQPLRYLLQEQRLLCTVIGIALTSAFFYLQPDYGFQYGFHGKQQQPVELLDASSSSQIGASYDRHARELGAGVRGAAGVVAGSGKLPLGLRRRPLRIVVTGGAGFVGSHLVDKLILRGDRVIVVDNLFTGRKENVMHHFGNPQFELIRHDIVEPLMLEVDHIYHLACPASPVHYKFNPVKTIISSSSHLTY